MTDNFNPTEWITTNEAAELNDLYTLEFLFDGSQIDKDDLWTRIHREFKLQRDSPIQVELEEIPSPGETRCLKLSIQGSLKDVDRCHLLLRRREVVDRRYCILLRDEAGDEIRQQAYPVLAQIEQHLRTFINRAMTEIVGFDWWETMVPRGVRKRVGEVQDKPQTKERSDHPLALTYLYDLMTFVTGSIRRWSEDRAIFPADLADLLSECSSIDELREKLTEKTRSVSLWDEVFARYYPDEQQKQQWSELKKTIAETVVPIRDRVMHHRPVFHWELEELERVREDVRELIDSAVEELPEDERVRARQVSEEWGLTFVKNLMQQEELIREIVRPSVEAIRTVVEMQPEWLARGIVEASLPSEELLRSIEGMRPSIEMLARIQEYQEQQAPQPHEGLGPMESDAPYVGSIKGVKFHLPTCTYVNQIALENRIPFADKDDAISQGYLPCSACEP